MFPTCSFPSFLLFTSSSPRTSFEVCVTLLPSAPGDWKDICTTQNTAPSLFLRGSALLPVCPWLAVFLGAAFFKWFYLHNISSMLLVSFKVKWWKLFWEFRSKTVIAFYFSPTGGRKMVYHGNHAVKWQGNQALKMSFVIWKDKLITSIVGDMASVIKRAWLEKEKSLTRLSTTWD